MTREYEEGEIAVQREAGIDIAKVDRLLWQIKQEFLRASGLHKPFASPHEAYGVIKEEIDELWDDVKSNDIAHAHIEAVQVAAMCVRFMHDIEPRINDTKTRPFSKEERASLRTFLRLWGGKQA